MGTNMLRWIALAPLLWALPALAQVVTTWPPPAGTIAFLCVYNSSVPTPVNGSPFYVQCDGSGNVRVTASSLPLPSGAATAANQITGSQYGNQANWKSGSGVATNTAATTIIAAPGSNKLYITGVQCFRTDAGTAASYVTLNDGASTVIGLANSGGGGGNNQVYNTPLVVAVTTALTFTSSTSLSSVYCNAQGYNAP